MEMNLASTQHHNFTSVWSLNEEVDMTAPAFLGVQPNVIAVTIHYQGLSHSIHASSTWWQVRLAADRLIRDSGDTHHVFIEGFFVIDESNIELQTGS